jgi:hypothetical protein
MSRGKIPVHGKNSQPAPGTADLSVEVRQRPGGLIA